MTLSSRIMKTASKSIEALDQIFDLKRLLEDEHRIKKIEEDTYESFLGRFSNDCGKPLLFGYAR